MLKKFKRYILLTFFEEDMKEYAKPLIYEQLYNQKAIFQYDLMLIGLNLPDIKENMVAFNYIDLLYRSQNDDLF